MVGVLRSVIARFTVDVDDKPLTALDKRMNALKSRVTTFAGYATAAFAVVGGGAYMLAEAASRADENWAAIEITFGKNAEGIKEWSKDVGKAMSRSEYSFQEAAVSFGKFLAPMFRDSGQDITEMSKKLAELAVDLASFHDVTDEEAQMRLFSGMAGETEAVRKLGIDLSDTGLNEFNSKAKGGDGRKMQQLTLAEKSWIRYRKIIKDTTDAVGDAQRSGDRWAGVLKRVQGRIKTVSVEWGRRLMPIMTKVLVLVDNAMIRLDRLVTYLADHTEVVSAAFYTAAAAAAYWAYQNSILTLSMEYLLKRALPVVAAFLAIEDVVVGLNGGDAIFSRLTEALIGMKRTAFLVKDAFQAIIIKIRNMYKLLTNLPEVLNTALFHSSPENMKKVYDKIGLQDVDTEIDKRKSAAMEEAMQNDDLKAFKEAAYDYGQQTPDAVRKMYLTERLKFLAANPDHAPTKADEDLGIGAGGVDLLKGVKVPSIAPGTPPSMLSEEQKILRMRYGAKAFDAQLNRKSQEAWNKPVAAPAKVENTMSIVIDGAKDTKAIVDEIEERWSSMTREVNYSAAEGMDD